MVDRLSSSQYFRWIVAAMLFGLSFASYVERVNISIAAEPMMASLALTKSDIALAFNAFLLGYAMFQVPVGWLGDRFGARIVLGVSALFWTALTVATGFMPGIFFKNTAGLMSVLFTLRFLLGIAEASTFPVAAQAIHQWMLPSQRGTGNSIVLMGSSVASALTAPLVALCMSRFGWRASFYITASVSLLAALIWFAFMRRGPQTAMDEPSASVASPSQLPVRDWLNLNVLLFALSYAAEGYLLFTFISWLYIYLVEVRHFSLVRGGFMASLPWIAAIVATPLGGLLFDRLTASVGRIRSAQFIIASGYSLSGVLLLVASRVEGRLAAVLALSISLAAMYLAEASFWATATSIAPPHGAVVAGFMNAIGIVGGIASTSVMPWLLGHYGQAGWSVAFGVGTGMGLLTAVIWFILGARLTKSSYWAITS